MAEGKPPKERMTQKRVLAIVIAIVVVGSAGTVIWYLYYKSWNIEDVAAAIADTPDAPGFRHSLAGRTIVVEGRVTGISSNMINHGLLSFIELDNYGYLHLVVWGDVPYSIGETIRKEVRFEWSECNDETHVYSPQLDFPNLVTLPSMEVVVKETVFVGGYDLYPRALPDGRINISVLWADELLSLNSYNCSLRAGTKSFAGEYIDLMRQQDYGRELDRLQPLESTTGSHGNLTYVDSDIDGLLDRGDWFVLSGLREPSTESGFRTYLLDLSTPVVWDDNTTEYVHISSYVVLNKNGLLRWTNNLTPGLFAGGTISEAEISVSVQYTTDTVPWDQSSIYVISNASYWLVWHLSSENLTGTGPMIEDLGVKQLGLLNVRLFVRDAQGNGVIDPGDSLTLVPESGTLVTTDYYQIMFMYNPVDTSMGSVSFNSQG